MNSITNPLICVILINYNGYEDTRECVKSLLDCEYANLKICIIDNDSKENPVKYDNIITKSHCEIIHLTKNIGFSGGNNIGIKELKKYNPDYYLILNNDTVVEKGFLNPLIDACKNDVTIGIATGKVYYYDEPDLLWFGGSYFDRGLGEYKIKGLGCKETKEFSKEETIYYATACFWLLPVKVVEEVGYMSEDYFLYYEDADYCERLKKYGYKIAYLPNSIIFHKESRSTAKGSDLYTYYVNRNYLFFIKKHASRQRGQLIAKRFIRILKDVIRGRTKCKIAYMIYSDFILNRKGKRLKI